MAIPSGMLQPGMTLFVSSDGSDWSNTSQPMVTTGRSQFASSSCLPSKTGMERTKVAAELPKKPAGVPTPIKPVYPEELEKPEKITYKWWQFQKKRRQRLEPIVETVDPRMERYERAYENYVSDSLAYPAKLNNMRKQLRAGRLKQCHAKSTTNRSSFLENAKNSTSRIQRFKRNMTRPLRLGGKSVTRFGMWHYAKLAEANLINTADLNAYAFRLAQTGWINCDRFYDIPKTRSKTSWSLLADMKTPKFTSFLMTEKVFYGQITMVILQKGITSQGIHYGNCVLR